MRLALFPLARASSPVLTLVLFLAGPSEAAISWDGGGGSNWWFDPANWSQDAFGYLPPSQDSSGTLIATDAQINVGTGAWDVTGEGVVYDPANDPFFAAASSRSYPTGSSAATLVGRDYGPEHIFRLYVSRNTTNANLLTIKSGDLVIASTTIIGRSGSNATTQNQGRVVQTGGSLRLPLTNLDIGETETASSVSTWGNGVYEYLGGTLEVALEGGTGIRLAHGNSAANRGPSGVNRFVIGNGAPGHIRTWDYSSISYRGTADGVFTQGADPNGVDRGVATTEFLFENGGVRPVQVGRNLTLNNGVEPTTGAILSSRLELTLNQAPAVDGGGVPGSLGLFDVNFDIGFGDNGGLINGFGDANGDTVVDQNDQIFANADGSQLYPEGSTVSAIFGNTRYDWTISYTGQITWADADNSIVASISGPSSGNDVVLIGLGSQTLQGPVTGDFNGDGKVDSGDLSLLLGNWGSPVPPTPSGWTGFAPTAPGIDSDELSALLGNWGFGSGTAVPEPTASLLVVAGAAALFGARRR